MNLKPLILRLTWILVRIYASIIRLTALIPPLLMGAYTLCSTKYHAKKSALDSFLDYINISFHCIILTETWNSPINIDLCFFERYSGVHTFRAPLVPSRGGPGGGVSVFVLSNLYRIRKINELSICDEKIETCVAQVIPKNSTDSSCHFIVAIYRPHTDTVDNFVDALHQILIHPILHNQIVILAGDMNINITREFDTRAQNYLSLLGSLNFIPTITKPTRFPSSINNPLASSPSTLDHIFINQIKDFRSIIFDYDISDHCGTALVFLQNDSINSNPLPRKITFRPYSEQNFAELYDKLSSTNWDLVLAQTDHDHQLLSFSNHVNSLYRACFPKKIKILTENRKKKDSLLQQQYGKLKLNLAIFNSLKKDL